MLNIRVASYNICHAQGIDNKVNLKRIADVLACSGAQLIGLQEVDKHLPRSYFINQAKELGQYLHKFWVFGANLHWGTAQYGNAVLCHWPINIYRHYLLTSKSEQRGLLEAEMLLDNRKISFFCTHLGLNKEERLQQVEEILSIISRSPYPAILVGDFNDKRSSKEYSLLTSVLQDATTISGEYKTFPSNQPSEQIDFVLVSKEWKIVQSFTLISHDSDHLPVVVDLRLEDQDMLTDIKLHVSSKKSEIRSQNEMIVYSYEVFLNSDS